MIASIAKTILEKVVDKYTDIVRIARNKVEEDKYRSDEAFPFVSFLSADGDFDERYAKEGVTYSKVIPNEISYYEFQKMLETLEESEKYFLESCFSLDESEAFYLKNSWNQDQQNKATEILGTFGYNKRYIVNIRGAAKMPIEVRVHCRTEIECEEIVLKVVGNLQRDFVANNMQGKIYCERFGNTDWISNIGDYFVSFVFVTFILDVAGEVIESPHIGGVKNIVSNSIFSGGGYGKL